MKQQCDGRYHAQVRQLQKRLDHYELGMNKLFTELEKYFNFEREVNGHEED
jgi:hypothetical protein